MELIRRIKGQMARLNLKPSDVVRKVRSSLPPGSKVKFAQGTLSTFLNGKTDLGVTRFMLLCRAIELTTDLDPHPIETPTAEIYFGHSVEESMAAYGRKIDPVQYVAIPLVEGKMALGSPMEVAENVKGWALIHRKKLKGREHRDLLAVEVEGDSMVPVLRSGAIVAIDRSDKKITKQGIFAIRISGKCTVKYARIEGHQLILYPHNLESREEFQAVIDLRVEGDPIIGRIVWSWQSLI